MIRNSKEKKKQVNQSQADQLKEAQPVLPSLFFFSLTHIFSWAASLLTHYFP
jgi:hypothetical protein